MNLTISIELLDKIIAALEPRLVPTENGSIDLNEEIRKELIELKENNYE